MSFLTGKKESSSSLPEWMAGPSKEMLQRSLDMSKVGYMPYAGPQVAALDPAQVASMYATDSSAQAFGMPSAIPRIQGPTDFGGGTFGYSSMPLYDQQQQWFAETRPGQKQFYDSMFVDPYTGLPVDAPAQAPAQEMDVPTLLDQIILEQKRRYQSSK